MQTWAHLEGIRDTDMVVLDLSSRFGASRLYEPPEVYQSSVWYLDALWKIIIRPVPWADWNWKRVGVILQRSWPKVPTTLLGSCFAPLSDGREEWHVHKQWEASASASGQPDAYLEFIVWYQDGLGKTYYDDNHGHDYRTGWEGSEIVLL